MRLRHSINVKEKTVKAVTANPHPPPTQIKPATTYARAISTTLARTQTDTSRGAIAPGILHLGQACSGSGRVKETMTSPSDEGTRWR
jgi:hypothetical protein